MMNRRYPFNAFDNNQPARDYWMDERLPRSTSLGQPNPLSVALDIYENERGYELVASLPGVSPDDLEILVDPEKITLSGTNAPSTEPEDEAEFICRERRSGPFQRTVRLPEAIDTARVEATLIYGVLKVDLPKLNPTVLEQV